jgi:hypothetical protein
VRLPGLALETPARPAEALGVGEQGIGVVGLEVDDRGVVGERKAPAPADVLEARGDVDALDQLAGVEAGELGRVGDVDVAVGRLAVQQPVAKRPRNPARELAEPAAVDPPPCE